MRALPLLCLALGLSACDLALGDRGDYGEMTATVRGALALDLHGTAQVYRAGASPNAELYLNITNDFARQITLTTADSAALAVGRYALADGTLTAIAYEVDNRTERLFTGTRGTLTVDRVGADGDAFGGFRFVAVDRDGAEVSIEGSFRARDHRLRSGAGP